MVPTTLSPDRNSMPSAPKYEPVNDPRSVNDLITAALTDPDSDAAWQAIGALHYRATWEVVQRAEEFSTSPCSIERSLAASMLAQLGVTNRVYKAECQHILRQMLINEKEDNALDAIICALGHQNPSDLPELLSRFISHPSPDMRWSVTLALSQQNSALAITQLIILSRDEDPAVRDWATSGLGNSERDTPEIRQALLDRVNDSDCDTRGEALSGLARFNHPGVIALVERELHESEKISDFTLDAVELLADPQLIAHLQKRQVIEGSNFVALQRTIDACTKPPAT
jgi:HEAT repeat protein